MPVSQVKAGTETQRLLTSRQKAPDSSGFAKKLSEALPDTEKHPTTQAESGKVSYIELGKISKETPTVSHVLKNHPEFSNKCWDIIFTSVNRDKPFRKMREGTVVALKPDSNELVWGRELTEMKQSAPPSSVATSPVKPADRSREHAVEVGTISKNSPTVSHLFQANPRFDRGYWNIINDPVNRDKPFTTLRPGTKVVLNTSTRELSFEDGPRQKPDSLLAGSEKAKTIPRGEVDHASLVEAVKPYIGTPYNRIDCYGLIVRGLQKQGIQYAGQGGIRERLERLALHNGLPRNAYLNGEGLVEKAGTKVYSRSMLSISNAGKAAEDIYAEMSPHLREGFILSFSTPSKGHTGVVSKQGKEWTYINSGVIDNQISPTSLSKGVSEEFLRGELKNWLTLAANKKESLTVTMGHVDGQELTNFGG